MIRQSRQDVILDDGEYYVVLMHHQFPEGAVGFLERRCSVSDATPNGRECV